MAIGRELKSLLLPLAISIVIQNSIALSSHPLLLITVFDGFRHSFLDKELTPNLWEIAESGVRLDIGMRSQMTPMTAPSHFCLSTGLNQESHGIVGNEFYDPELDATYEYWTKGWDQPSFNVAEYHKTLAKFYHSEPIWVTNERASETGGEDEAGRVSGAMNWPHSDVPINGRLPKVLQVLESCCDAADNLTAWKNQFRRITNWFTRDPDPVNFVLFYVAQPDHIEHMHGTEDARTKKVIKDVDRLAGFMKQELQRTGLWEKVNLIFTADHGFVNVKYPNDVIPMKGVLEDYGLTGKAEWSCGGRCLVFKDNSKVKSTYEKLKKSLGDKVKVYLKESDEGRELFRDYYHFHQNRRIGEIIFLEKSHFLDFNFTNATLQALPEQMRGQHSFSPDRSEMRPLLFFHGPKFKEGFLMGGKGVENLDLYPLMCRILDIEPLPNNGSLHHLWPALGHMDGKLAVLVYSLVSSHSVSLLLLAAIAIPVFAFLCYLFALCRTSRGPATQRGTRYAPLESGSGHMMSSSTGRSANGSQAGRSKPLLEIEGNLESMSEDEL